MFCRFSSDVKPKFVFIVFCIDWNASHRQTMFVFFVILRYRIPGNRLYRNAVLTELVIHVDTVLPKVVFIGFSTHRKFNLMDLQYDSGEIIITVHRPLFVYHSFKLSVR